ncbi:MAG: hypothetical protein ABI905_14355 [Betaproteobacteria bacterium]
MKRHDLTCAMGAMGALALCVAAGAARAEDKPAQNPGAPVASTTAPPLVYMLLYTSPFKSYRGFSDDKRKPWLLVNEEVRTKGMHGQMQDAGGEMTDATPPAAVPAAPPVPTAPVPSPAPVTPPAHQHKHGG